MASGKHATFSVPSWREDTNLQQKTHTLEGGQESRHGGGGRNWRMLLVEGLVFDSGG